MIVEGAALFSAEVPVRIIKLEFLLEGFVCQHVALERHDVSTGLDSFGWQASSPLKQLDELTDRIMDVAALVDRARLHSLND